jgi:hypothetical protein
MKIKGSLQRRLENEERNPLSKSMPSPKAHDGISVSFPLKSLRAHAPG